MKHLAIAAALTAALTAAPDAIAQATGDYQSLAVTTTDGATTLFPLTTSLTLGFTEEALTLTDNGIAIEIPRALLAGFKWSREEASVERIAANGTTILPEVTDNAIIFRGLPQGSAITVFTPAGLQTASVTAAEETRLPLEVLPAGTSIIATATGSFKISINPQHNR